MDLLATLKAKIDALPDGEYVTGLRAVLLHIETAFGHLARGQSSGEDTAFTDTVYRTNQAFEGSVKEAYRVLAGRNPEKERPYDIERYLESEHIFRSRVLSQFTNYRTEWRNPSTHDYKLDFDESESFLPIVSVTAFACLLLDQITERLSFEATRLDAEAMAEHSTSNVVETSSDDLAKVESAVLQFIGYASSGSPRPAFQSEAQFTGSLAGFLTPTMPYARIEIDHRLRSGGRERADVLVAIGNRSFVIEVKRTQRVSNAAISAGLGSLEHYLQVGAIDSGVLLFFTPDDFDYQSDRVTLALSGKTASVIRPVADAAG